MSILVTGSAGQLGAEICRNLGADAVGVDIDTLDLTDRPTVLGEVRRLAPEAVVHCAAYTAVDKAETEADLARAVNATAVETLAIACRERDIPLVQISTDYLFAGSPGIGRPWREDDPPSPKGVYAVTKFEGELAAACWPKHYIVRTCGLYARPSHLAAKNFVKTIIRLARSQPKLRVVDDQTCTPSYVPHVARAVLFLLGTYVPLPSGRAPSGYTKGKDAVLPCPSGRGAGGGGARPAPWGIYNVTNQGQTTWCGLAREIVRLTGLEVPVEPITTVEFAAPAPRPAYSVLDTTAYHRLGGPAMPDWKEALGEYFEELRHIERECQPCVKSP
jgi:dTDP-4-dehydrorhamnose reductase